MFIHEKCRKHFNNRKRIAAESKSRINDEKMPKMQTRNSTEPYSWETNCFFCGVVIKDSDGAWHEVLNNKTKKTLQMKCKERLDQNQEDSLALNVKARLEGTLDLVASKAKYYQNCRKSFSVMRPGKKV